MSSRNRRRSSGFGVNMNLSVPLSAEDAALAKTMIKCNDDEAEREQLRLKRIDSLDSSGSENVKVELTPDELGEIFTETLRLSAAGKINIKNTWDLPLIEHMGELIGNNNNRNKNQNKSFEMSEEDHVNFQKASCTIDASVKIYSSRVDSVHNQTYKVLGGLHRNNKDYKPEQEVELDPLDQVQEDEKKRATKTTKKPTLVASSQAINDKSSKSSLTTFNFSIFSESNGYLMDDLPVHNGCRIYFDGDDSKEPSSSDSAPLELPQDLVDEIISIASSSAPIIPIEYRKFEHLLEKAKKLHGNASSLLENPSETPLELPENNGESENEFDDEDLEGFGFDNMDHFDMFDANDHTMFPDDEDIQNKSGSHFAIRLSSKADDYSWYDPTSLKRLSGMDHWKLASAKELTEKKVVKSKRKAKELEPIDFLNPPDKKINLCPASRAATTLSEAKLKKQVEDAKSLLLPRDYKFSHDILINLFSKPGTTLHRVMNRGSAPHIEYSRPETAAFGDYDEDDDDVGFDNYGESFPLNSRFTQSSEPSMQLIHEPTKAQKMDIKYARFSKKVDVRGLKASMWQTLHSELKASHEEKKSSTDQEFPSSFQGLINEVNGQLPAIMSKSVSVPFYFISLLHLANEHSLVLTHSSSDSIEFGDFTIRNTQPLE